MKFGEWLGLIALFLSLYILWQIRQLLLLLFTAVVLATALNRLARYLQKRGLKRPGAVMLAIVAFLSFFALTLLLVVPAFSREFNQLTILVPQGVDRLNQWVVDLKSHLSPQIIDLLPNLNDLAAQIQPLANRLLGSSWALVSTSLGVVLNILFLLVLTFMFLANPGGYRDLFIRLFPSFYRRRVDDILQQCERSLASLVIGMLISMVVVAGLSGIGLLILGVRAPLANAIVAGLLNFIPNLGPAFSVIPPTAIALLDSEWKALLVVVFYIAIQQFESTLLTPYIMSQQVALLPALTLLCQVFFATLFGFLGLLMALPLTVVGQVWLREALIKDVLDPWQHHDRRFVIRAGDVITHGDDGVSEVPSSIPPDPSPPASAG
jgi:predicted PurR-regulated permease PerM